MGALSFGYVQYTKQKNLCQTERNLIKTLDINFYSCIIGSEVKNIMEKRKHYSQMTQLEINAIVSKVKEIENYKIDSYTFNRMLERNISEKYLSKVLKDGFEIIEIHNNINTEIRVLIRAKIYEDSICFVLSLTEHMIVTCYWNAANDYHKTLDQTKYTWQVDIFELLNYNACETCTLPTSNRNVCMGCIVDFMNTKRN